MFVEGIFGVGIGLIFTWFVLSVATAQIQEWVASLFQWRGVNLKTAIEGMLCSKNLTSLFYDHPVIRSLSERSNGRDTKPSYIPANQFSVVMLDIMQSFVSEPAILVYGLHSLPASLKRIKAKKKRQEAQKDLSRIFEIARLTDANQKNETLDNLITVTLEREIIGFGEQYVELKELTHSIIEDARVNKIKLDEALKSMPNAQGVSHQSQSLLSGSLALGLLNPEIKTIVNTLLIGTKDPTNSPDEFIQKIRSNIETWFNDSMDRLSGWYKRKAQFSTFLIGLICACLLNIDSIHLTTQLWQEPILREAIANNASMVLEQNVDENGAIDTETISIIQLLQDQYLSLPIGWNFYSVKVSSLQACSFSPLENEVFGISTGSECIRPLGAQANSNGWLWLFFKTIGLFMSGLASAQGSSFWFDILSKLINMRSAGKKPV